MILKSADGLKFYLVARGYEFPEIDDEHSECDSNWLNVRIDVNVPQGGWSAAGPYLLTTEAVELLRWLETITAGKTPAAPLRFIEPHLSFILEGFHGNQALITIHTEAEFLPHGLEDKGLYPAGYDLKWKFSLDSLKKASEEWKSEIALFPKR